MGTVTTDRAITAQWTIENHGAPGVFGMVSREQSQSISIEVIFVPNAARPGPAGGEIIELVHAGDSCSFDLSSVETIRVFAGTVADPGLYPISALVNFTVLPITLTCAPFLAGGAGGNAAPGAPSSVVPLPVNVVSSISGPTPGVTLVDQAVDPAPPPAGQEILFKRTDGHLYLMEPDGSVVIVV